MKILFVFTPAVSGSGNRAAARFMIMPIGFLALADLMARAGHEVEILHVGIEKALDRRFDLSQTVKQYQPDLVAVTLHFHHQLAAVHDAVKEIKRAVPDTRVVLGGFTASFFYRDIMNKWTDVDFVVRGDGDVPLYQLAAAIEHGDEPIRVPNLSFRRGQSIISTEFAYRGDVTVLNKLKFSNLSLLRHREFYAGGFVWRRKDGLAPYLKNEYFYLCGGRGCSVNCAYCAGASSSQQIISNRPRPILRTAQSLADDVMRLHKYGKDKFYLCFDPPRRGCAPYMDFMGLLKSSGIRVSMIFEAYSRLPGESFVREFADTFAREFSALAFSPTTANESARKFYNGVYHTNDALEKKLSQCARHRVNTVLYFTLFPAETIADLKKSCAWAKHLAETYGAASIFMPVEIEPGAPWHLHPEKYKLTLTCSTFDDFVERSRRRDFSRDPDDPGYVLRGFRRKMEYIAAQGFAPSDYGPEN